MEVDCSSRTLPYIENIAHRIFVRIEVHIEFATFTVAC